MNPEGSNDSKQSCYAKFSPSPVYSHQVYLNNAGILQCCRSPLTTLGIALCSRVDKTLADQYQLD